MGFDMKIGTGFNISGDVIKDNEAYTLTDNHVLQRTIVSSTLLHPKKTTRGHEHKGQEEVYIFVRGSGFMYIDEDQFPVTAGDIITVQDGEFHRVANPNDEDLYFICIFEGERKH